MRRGAKASLVAAFLTGALAFGGAPAALLAQEADESFATPGTPVAGESETFAPKSNLPVRYDQRTAYPNAVSPVRFQSPWGSCWAFGAIAAAETSINSRYDADVDLSERHLTWFGLTPVDLVDDPVQSGEGIYAVGGEEFRANGNYKYNLGGFTIESATLFASGAGPVLEEDFPYHGKEGRTLYDVLVRYPDLWKQDLHASLLKKHQSDAKILEAEGGDFEGLTGIDDFLERRRQETLQYVSDGTWSNEWSSLDDWTISSTDAKGLSNRNKSAGFVLEKSESMPKFANYDERAKETMLDAGCMQAVKQELMEGRGVVASYYAEDPVIDQTTKHSRYYNENEACYYVYDLDGGANHTIAIVGWDDQYPASNFEGTFTEEGKVVTKYAPPGNGAWIVRNSWGMKDGCEQPQTPGVPVIGKADYGYQGSGYFYISYYDLSLVNGESFEFSRTLDTGVPFIAHQYDYLPGLCDDFSFTSKEVVASANVYEADEDQRIESLATRTDYVNSDVTYNIYLLNQGATGPMDGEVLTSFTVSCGYPGYYRHDLPTPVDIREGERFSVVVTKSFVDGGQRYYAVNSSAAWNKQHAEKEHEEFLKKNAERVAKEEPPEEDRGCSYGVVVVKPGESYVYGSDDRWVDWVDYQKTAEFKKIAADTVVDNFCIKAFAVPTDAEETTFTYRCVKGDNQQIIRGLDGLAATIGCQEANRDAYDHFSSASLDGKALDASDYTLSHDRKNGRVTITLSSGLLSGLSLGAHTLTVAFDNGNPVYVSFRLTEGHVTPDGNPLLPGTWVDDSDDDDWSEDLTYDSDGTYYSEGVTGGSYDAGYDDGLVDRLSGDDRYETMEEIISEGFEKSDVVVLASGEGFADALTASALAGAHGAPVVLTESGRLSEEAQGEIARLGASRVIILGGTASVSQAVENAVKAVVPDVTRVFGADRVATSVASLQKARAARPTSDTVIIASGSSYADALSIGPWSWRTASPIVLARDGLLTQEAIDAITSDHAIKRIVIVGGISCVSDQVRTQLGDGYEYVRLGGADRYETSSLIAAWTCERGLGWSRPVVATGRGFADALSGASLAGTLSSPLLLMDDGEAATVKMLQSNKKSVKSVLVLGGKAAVNASTEQAVRKAIA